MTTTQTTPPGWYPDPEGQGQRYFDGTQWTEYRSGVHQTPPRSAQAGQWQGGPPPVVGPAYSQPRPPKKSNTWKWVVGAIGALFVIGAIAGGSSNTSTDADAGGNSGSQVASSGKKSENAEQKAESNKDPEKVEKPEPKPEPPAKPAEPEMTSGQENALNAGQNYLDMMPFSKAGLIRQLSSSAGDGYSKADATFAANHVDADWNKEAVEAAKNYLDTMPMSKDALIQQLSSSAGDKYTRAQARYAASKVY